MGARGADVSNREMTAGKRILLLTPQIPYPPQQGTTIRNYNLIRQLAKTHEIHLLSLDEEPGRLASCGPLIELCRTAAAFPIAPRSMGKRLRATLLSPLPDMALRLRSDELEDGLATRLSGQDFDVIQAEGIEMASHILSLPRGKPTIVFDDHNAEYVLQKRAFETDALLPSRWPAALYSLIQWRKLGNYERRVCRHADRVVVCSQADRLALERLVPELPVSVIPNGVDIDYYQPEDVEIPNRLVFTGKMDFRPNVDAVLWLYDEVIPRLRELVPGIHLCVAGKNPHPRLSPLRRDLEVTLTGQVPDIRPYISQAALYVVPLRIGGGTRLKVLEAMAMGKAVLSTSLGCEGLDVTPGRDIILADTPEDFALKAAALLNDPPTRKVMGRRARKLVEERYDWRTIIPRFDAVYAH